MQFFQPLIMASMWNLLAGYSGLVSVGQQAFVGLGAYAVVILASHGMSPFLAVPVATLAGGVIGLPIWWLVSRLRSGYFSITMWVIASVCMLIIIQVSSVGGRHRYRTRRADAEPDTAERRHLLGHARGRGGGARDHLRAASQPARAGAHRDQGRRDRRTQRRRTGRLGAAAGLPRRSGRAAPQALSTRSASSSSCRLRRSACRSPQR